MALKRTKRKMGGSNAEVYTLDIPIADLKALLEAFIQRLAENRANRPPVPENRSPSEANELAPTRPQQDGVHTYTYNDEGRLSQMDLVDFQNTTTGTDPEWLCDRVKGDK
jgi:YD repeat-containing protein